jgi:hypothetical protein
MGAIDMIEQDIHFWGGLELNSRLIVVAETLQLGIATHSDRELGISTSAMLHFLASHPYVKHPADSHYHHQVDDVITEPFTYRDGKMKVPRGPGLGVEIDRKKLEQYASLYRQQGDVNEFYDARRPGWVPEIPTTTTTTTKKKTFRSTASNVPDHQRNAGAALKIKQVSVDTNFMTFERTFLRIYAGDLDMTGRSTGPAHPPSMIQRRFPRSS